MNKCIPLSCLILCSSFTAAKDNGTAVYTNPKEAPASYAIQGEYEGVAKGDGNQYAGQIIALGEGNFRLVGYKGRLPGEGKSHKDVMFTVDGKMDGEAAKFETDEFLMYAGDGKIKVVDKASEKTVGSIPRVVRKSDTLGAEPPEGALVLFDGTSGDGFENSQVHNGLLLANCFSKETFDDHTLHIEFRTPFKPKGRGQGRGNSGVYVQSRYELQVLDSFALAGKNNECGGIYSISEPKVNMCFPPLQWQTYDIDFTAARYDSDGKKTKNARVTVKHNGVVIHDDLELPHGTPGRHKEGPGPDGVYLQGHGNPVYYRNIWVVKK